MQRLEKLSFTVPPNADGMRLSDFLRKAGLTAGFIRSVKYQPEGITVNGVKAFTNTHVAAGSLVQVHMPAEPQTSVQPEAVPLSILYESDYAVVLEKPAGQLVHPSVAQATGTLAGGWRYFMEQRGIKAPFRPITRLDKNTSGLVLCAKNRFAAPILAKALHKTYLAVAQGEICGTGQINAPIARSENSLVSRCVSPNGKPSCTCYRALASGRGHTLLAVWLVTGRTHQIRVHFASIGHPLAGDDMYGGSQAFIGRQALHAAALRWQEPFGEQEKQLFCPPPKDLQKLCQDCSIDLEKWLVNPEFLFSHP